MKDSAIGARIRARVDEERQDRGMEEAELLRLAGITPYRFRAAMGATRGPRIRELCDLADALKVEVSALLHDDRGPIWEERSRLNLGEILRANVLSAMDAKEWSHSDLASQVGVTPSRLTEVLGAMNPSIRVVHSIAAALGVTVDELLEPAQ